MVHWLADPQIWLAFLSLTLLEIVLGIDNLIFLSILVGRLPEASRRRARRTGLSLAMLTRIALLLCVVALTRLVRPWLQIGPLEVSGRDLILLVGGLFLLAKSVLEIHHTMEGAGTRGPRRSGHSGFAATVMQIALIDIVFSLDSVFTAVGLARDVPIMIAAIVTSIAVMMSVARPIGVFIDQHPTIKLLALSFLILIGVALVAQALHFEIPKGYLYFAMGFAVVVEMINIRLRRLLARHKPRDEEEGG